MKGTTRPANSHDGFITSRISPRETLVFEREITLTTGGKSRRCSLSVPAVSMHPEMVDLMLELKDLNRFFQGESGEANSVNSSDKDARDVLIPPSLMVSNSECSVPILLDPSRDSPVALAVRRGKKVPPPLSFKHEAEQDPYPGIPTAFLGSPSTYSPKFEFANRQGARALDLEDMVASLKSHCLSIDDNSCDPRYPVHTKTPRMSNHVKATRSPADEEDEWAFAADLLKTYGETDNLSMRFLPDSDRATRSSTQGNPMHYSSANNGPELDSDASDKSVDASLNSIDSCYNQVVIRPGSDHPLRALPDACPPSADLPHRPAFSRPTTSNITRGILKRCKSVRFASLPSEHGPDPTKSPLTTPRRPTRSASITSLQRLSPLRNNFVSETGMNCARTNPIVSPSHPVAVSPASRRKPLPTHTPVSRPLLTPTPTQSPTRPAVANSFSIRRTVTKLTAEPKKTPSPKTASLGRNSLGRLIRTSPGKGKENKATSSFPQISRWSSVNENMLRREGVQFESKASKSRMPVPLRNIFTRFK
jgi:hypothetical protein